MIVSIGKLFGQFGNQLFQYCACRYFSEQLHSSYSFPSEWFGKNIITCDLGIQANDIHIDEPSIHRDGHSYLNTDALRKLDEDLVLLDGYFQNEQYINKDWLPINNIPIPNIDFDAYCLIHVRGTNYLGTSHVLDGAYFSYAQQKILEVNPKLKFIVITDDIPVAKQWVNADYYYMNTREVDFKLMSMSKYLIIPNSTFSWWASYLNRELIYCIGPSGWRHPNDRYLSTSHFNLIL